MTKGKSTNVGSTIVLFLLAGAILAVPVLVGLLRVGRPPVIAIKPALAAIGRRTPVTIDVSEPVRGLSRVSVEVVQGERRTTLVERGYDPRGAFAFWGSLNAQDTIKLDIGKDTVSDLQAGQVTVRVTAHRAPTWLRHPDPAVQEVTLPVRLTPPTLQVLSSPTYVAQGGCEIVVYKVGESSTRDGVQSGKWWFPGFPVPGGAKDDRFALFAVPYDMAVPTVRLVAADAAGNAAERSFVDQFFPKPVKGDTIQLTDAFLSKVVPEILGQTPSLQGGTNELESYLKINRELRTQNNDALKEISAKSTPSFLWNRPFLPMLNGKVMAAFADRRTYIFQGREVDRQDHLGFDLAVTKHAPVPAANSGVVALARYFGIFGNAVVIDHGYGLMSLYGHLSTIGVKEGQKVNRGDTIGNTGETGLAGGDHLHFTTMLQGLPVNPVEWWDPHWIQDRIAAKLPALHFDK
jgi:murein DD-endopeptidase MepM/ murein hydrolase activator NlpD